MNAMPILLNVRYWILAALVIGFIFGDIGGEYDAILIIVFLMIMIQVSSCFLVSSSRVL